MLLVNRRLTSCISQLTKGDASLSPTAWCPTPGRGRAEALEPCGVDRAIGHVLGKESHSLVTMSDTQTWLTQARLFRTPAVPAPGRARRLPSRRAGPFRGGLRGPARGRRTR